MMLLCDQLAATETFEDSKEEIRQIVYRFRRKYGGDIDELLDIAYLQHAKLWNIYMHEPHRVKNVRFLACLNRWVWHGLLDVRRREAVKHAAHPACPLPEQLPAKRASDFNVGEFLEGLSEDARLVAQMVLNPDDELQAAAEERGGRRCNLRAAIRAMLTYTYVCPACDGDGCDEVRPGEWVQCPECHGADGTDGRIGRWAWSTHRVTAAFEEVRAALT